MSCFKIMFVLGITDMAAIVVNSIITGILLLEGSVFCTHPIVNFIAGSMGLGLWCSACIVCLLLVTNRLMDITAPHLVKTIFGGAKTYFILILPFVYGLYFIIFTPPVVFSSKYGAWFFDPFIYPDRGLEYRSEYSTGKNKAHIFFQSSVICAINFFASIIYVIMQFIPVPHYLIIMGHVGWQLGHGEIREEGEGDSSIKLSTCYCLDCVNIWFLF
uniref:7TM_GPCR_Srx domain-containing protein n=1 Tax=Heterorhabditis bacteriophora TaxID=37862 RepID=A0A1I7XGE9_HETBA